MDETSGGLSILIIEDHESGRNLLRDLLQLDGHRVQVAEDGGRGLRAFETQEFDAALIDIGLPDMSGYDLARSMRRARKDILSRASGLRRRGIFPEESTCLYADGRIVL